MGKDPLRKNLLLLSWASYDLANQFFALNIISLYFPRWITLEKNLPEIFYSLSFGISMFFVAICAPILGTLSDMRGRHKAFLVYFTLLAIIFTVGMGLSHSIYLGLLFFAIANFGTQEAVVFYNALIVKVAPRDKIGFVSGLGRMFGYIGAILALYLCKPVIQKMGYQAGFIFTGLLFLIFALPCMIFIKGKPPKKETNLIHFFAKKELLQILGRLKQLFLDSRFAELKDFLKAIFFLLCALNTIMLFMSVYATKVFGLAENQIINLIGFSTIFAILGSIFSGFISDFIGYRKSLIGVFILWGICILGGGLLRPPFHWLIGALAGISLGSTWVICRALVVRLVPEERLGEAFGLFSVVAYLAAAIGPFLWGLMLLYFSTLGEWGYRSAFLSLILFVATGFILLLRMGRKAEKTS